MKIAVWLLALFGTVASAGDGVNLNITNDGIVDLYVTVYDSSSRPPTLIASHQRINGFASMPVSASADASGRANISWTAIGVDSRDAQCGRGAASGLAGDSAVNVHVDSDCSR
jgi:hypothetical protein